MASVSYAGEILLDNGDAIQGEIISISSDKVVWFSPVFGQINIPKNSIVDLYTSIPLKVRAREGACHWAGLTRGIVSLECDEGGDVEVSFLAIKEAVRFEGFRKATYEHRGKVTATGNKESGRLQKQDWNVNANIFTRHTDFRHDVVFKYRAESINNNPLKQQQQLSYKFDWFFAPRTFYSSKLEGIKDEFRFIEKRLVLSAALGYQFWENRISALSIETGPQYINETTFDNSNRDLFFEEDYGSWRLASNFNLLLPRDTRLYTQLEYLQSMGVGEDWEADTTSGLSLPIAGGITADIVYSFSFDNTPAEGVSSRDSRLRVGLGYQW